MISDGIKRWMSLCPLLEGEKLKGDFLSEKPPCFALYAEGDELILKKYASGDSLRQYTFSFRARMPYGLKAEENEKINMLFEGIGDWMEKEVKSGNLPDIGQGRTIQNLEVTDTAHLKNTNVSDCVYEMKLKATYYQRR